MKRRDFLKQTTFASGMFFVPQFLKAFEQLPIKTLSHKKVVIIQLKGGNDGLNTVVPFQNDIYYQQRNNIAIKQNDVFKISDEVGLHKSLQPLQDLYNKGFVSIINNVGYPNPNLSHFRSTDIWQTASDSNEYLQNGWVGRYLDYTKGNPYAAIEVDESLSLMMKGNTQNGLAITDPKMFYNSMRAPFFNNVVTNYNDAHLSEHNLGYLYNTMIDAKSSAKHIYEKSNTRSRTAEYPKNIFGKQLNTISQFINSGLETQVYYAGLSGFDTHANQAGTQERLLKVYAESMEVFINDLQKNNTFDDVLILTFSEFGRRVKQNESKGTDHGTANNVFVMGKNLKKQGLYNNLPNLGDLDKNGNLNYEIDFREIYATILDKWLQVDDVAILNKSFSKLNFV
ncbi:DUF1501 domain-containing protein [Polaribacter sp. R2A056_3_33]|jgi:uncharacterized protein (DUF1501 family)|uniref:DUF1501 domain-containing protein n=1 Tax=unclassified Polaribacter TaxID=196858 RepID=UPI001C4E8286|nr:MULTISPECIES: DUF1501 domain-containing protein [unclassified Polaribacter]QXP63638.1 DUF1501 domain-containing protein [Polaribacter sp. HaHaR_3_91]QXP71632.1 DUF1501 domain-containing protein [Polaribacter sp. R2A056_3_33]